MTTPLLLRLSLIGALALTQAGCLAAAVVGTTAGVAIGVTGAAVGATAKGVGMAAGAVIPGGGDKDDERKARRDR